MTQLVVPHMAKEKKGLVINVGSIVGSSPLLPAWWRELITRTHAGNIPTPWAGVYAASKAAIHSWTEVLRMEVKVRFARPSQDLNTAKNGVPQGLGVDVMLVAPGAITSGFGKKQLNSHHEPKRASRSLLRKSLNSNLLADSLYKSVASHIAARAEMSQRSGSSSAPSHRNLAEPSPQTTRCQLPFSRKESSLAL